MMDLTTITDEQLVHEYAHLRQAGTAVVNAAEISGKPDVAEMVAAFSRAHMRQMMCELERRDLTVKAARAARQLEETMSATTDGETREGPPAR
ncbi:hypothetical protein CSC82_11580 [Rhodobacteraceae bacterium 4F10]|nr:hypothetical protein CSC82_11580 [Rhodobacteraceae bacterium 4F10]